VKGLPSTPIWCHTSSDDEQRESQAMCLCRKALAESRGEPGNTNSSAASQGQVEPSQLSAQAVPPADGPWLNSAHTAKRVSILHLTASLGRGKTLHIALKGEKIGILTFQFCCQRCRTPKSSSDCLGRRRWHSRSEKGSSKWKLPLRNPPKPLLPVK